MTPAERISKRIPAFRQWLSARGAEIFEPTNDYELIRFKANGSPSVIYRTKRGSVTHFGQSLEAFEAFQSGSPWRAMDPTKRKKKMSPLLRAVRARDGNLCFFCQEIVDYKDESAEHLVSITCGGPNHISNLFLAHQICNGRADNLSAVEKIRIHVNAVLLKRGIK